jgi:hypothetical protein
MESYNSFREVEPLFLAVISGCNAGLFRKALHEVYIPRIQRGNACFAAKVLGARGALLLVLARFFEDLKSAGGLPNCIGSGGCFSRPLVRRKPKLRLRSAKPSALITKPESDRIGSWYSLEMCVSVSQLRHSLLLHLAKE